jgi:hypothetical protein
VETQELDQESHAFLAMARQLRDAYVQRDEMVHKCRERFDRAQDDLQLMPEKRLEIAGAFVRATYRADHIYEECLERSVNQYRDSSVSGVEDGAIGERVAKVEATDF